MCIIIGLHTTYGDIPELMRKMPLSAGSSGGALDWIDMSASSSDASLPWLELAAARAARIGMTASTCWNLCYVTESRPRQHY